MEVFCEKCQAEKKLTCRTCHIEQYETHKMQQEQTVDMLRRMIEVSRALKTPGGEYICIQAEKLLEAIKNQQ